MCRESQKFVEQFTKTEWYKTKQPDTPSADVSDPHPTLLSQTQVSNGVNNSQLALYAGEDVK